MHETFVKTDLGDKALLLHGFTGREALSEPFTFSLTLTNPLKDPPIDQQALLGTMAKLTLDDEYSADTRVARKPKRHFNGYVTRTALEDVRGEYRIYRVELRPWLWLLDKTSNCRVFQNMTVPEIVKDVCKKHGFNDVILELGTYKPREYCVQYRESDLAFVSRLLEHEGIYYYFRFDEAKHTLVLTDGTSPHLPRPQYERIEYGILQHGEDTTETLGGLITAWRPARELRSGNYTLKDYNFEKPNLPLLSRQLGPKPHKLNTFERFDYPGAYLEAKLGSDYASIRLQEEQTPYENIAGEGRTQGLAPGFVFNLAAHPDTAQNATYLVVSAEYDFALEPYKSTQEQAGRRFSCRFTALPSQLRFRPARVTPRPIIAGLQTAQVVGPRGEEIWTDNYGRVKVQFPWDREGQRNERSSCFIRVAQVWAGGGFGAQFVPRIGHEVVVSFLEGDPDRPMIVGSVYNGVNSPPFKLSDNDFVSGLKTESTRNGAGGNNQLYFQDKNSDELVFLRAERDLEAKVLRERRTDVGQNDIETVHGDQTITVTRTYSLTAQTVSITCGASSIELGPTGITVSAPSLTFTATGQLNLTAATEINAQAPKIDVLGDTAIPVLHSIPLPPRPPV